MSTVPVVQQYQLFDLGIDLTALRRAKENLMTFAKAPNTLQAYRSQWRTFTKWCAEAGRSACPATPDTVSLYVTWAAKVRQYRMETIHLALSSIKHHHEEGESPSPINREVRDLVRSAVREAREEPGGKEHLTIQQLRKICRRLREDEPIDIRDRALFLIGYATGWRRSELASLHTDHVRFGKQGVRLWLAFSKNDQEGKGRATCIPYGKCAYTCPVRALQAWMKVRGSWPGPVFLQFTSPGFAGHGYMKQDAISGPGIAVALKRALRRIGEDPDDYGAHSMRSGMITTAAENGVNLRAIMDRSGHKSIETIMRYVRSSPDAFRADPLAG